MAIVLVALASDHDFACWADVDGLALSLRETAPNCGANRPRNRHHSHDLSSLLLPKLSMQTFRLERNPKQAEIDGYIQHVAFVAEAEFDIAR